MADSTRRAAPGAAPAVPAASHTGGGRLSARPGNPSSLELAEPPGVHLLGLDRTRRDLLFVPRGADPERPAPLVVLLHGPGGEPAHAMALLQSLADDAGMVLLAPGSHEHTWDVVGGRFGRDVESLNRALARTFARRAIDPERLAIGGFSDGASYALSLGLVNGDLFTHVIAFSPGFMAAPQRTGEPRIFITHGTSDQVLPIACSRRLAPHLFAAGYPVDYLEFEGTHFVPDALRRAAVTWFLGEAIQL